MPDREPRPQFLSADTVNIYRTKDFRGEPVEGGGYKVVGAHLGSRCWLRENAGKGFRKQFMDERGYLRAEDEDELEALITQIQAEHG